MHEVLVNRLGGLSLPRKSVVRLTDRLDMTLDVYRGRKTTIQQHLIECDSVDFCSSVGSWCRSSTVVLHVHPVNNEIRSSGLNELP